MTVPTSPQRFFARPGLNSQCYDARTPSSFQGDVPFYLSQAEEMGGPVLELGSGTGRVAWQLARAGHDVTGLDLSSVMLAEAEAKRARMPAEVAARARFVHADMRSFDLDRRFRLAIVPFRAFNELPTADDERAALRSIRRHLEPDGRLVIDVFDPRLEYCLPEGHRAPLGRESVHSRRAATGSTSPLCRTRTTASASWCARSGA